jgi:MMP 1-O-methyltransferase
VRLPIDINTVKGFLDPEEGAELYRAGFAAAAVGPLLEIGSYCGKSAVYLGTAARDAGSVLFTLDHHRGSEEMQPGWEYHDPETWDAKAGAMDSLPFLRDTLRRAGLEEDVVPIVGRSASIARFWQAPLGFVFIDGGHAMAEAEADYRGWAPHVAVGGTLAIHDVFPDPKDGGRPPFEIFKMAVASGLFVETGAVKSLRLLQRR